MSDRKLPEALKPEKPDEQPLGINMGLAPNDTIVIQFISGDTVKFNVNFNADQATQFHNDFGKLLTKLRAT